MSDTDSEENKNKVPYKMARLAWPKAKYGVVLAVIMIIIINLIYYKKQFFHYLNKTVLHLKKVCQKTYPKQQKQKRLNIS